MVRPISTVLSRQIRNSASPTRDTLMSQTQTDLEFITPIARSLDEMQMWQTILPRGEGLRNEEYLGQVEEALRRAGIHYGQQSSMNPHPSPNSSPDVFMTSPIRLSLSTETWNTSPTPNGQSPLLCMNPSGPPSHMFLSPLNNGPKITYS